jgi:hypothetical protein
MSYNSQLVNFGEPDAAQSAVADNFAPVSVERDPEDVVTIAHLLRALFLLVVMLAASVGLNIYFALRKADLVVVDKSSGRTVAINNKDYGATEAVRLSPDNLTNRDKRALVEEFLRCLYEVNAATRQTNVNRLLKMMEPNASLAQARHFNEEKLLAQEKTESLNSSWELQDVTFDERDPYIVRALGKRIVRRVLNGSPVTEQTQIKVKFLLMDSPTVPVRNDNNFRTGYYVLRYRAETVEAAKSTPLMLLADEPAAVGGSSANPAGNESENSSEVTNNEK